jgi:GntR family transcriptional regulator
MSANGAANRESLSALVDDRLPTPLYHQIYVVLRERIMSGVYGFGRVLPGEQEISGTFGVSRITAKRALNELADGGFVKRERGRGTRVIHRPAVPPVEASVEGLLENLLTMGLETEVDLVDFGYVRADAEVAGALGCAEGAVVQRAVRVRHLDGAPFSHLTTHVPEDIGRSFSRDDLASKPLLALLERSGVVVGRAEQIISATLADAAVSRALGVEFGAPLLSIRRMVFDEAGRAVEFISALYRPDRYQYRMSLSRVGETASRSWSMTQ